MPYALSTAAAELPAEYEHMSTARKEAIELSARSEHVIYIDRVIEGQTFVNEHDETVVIKPSRKTVLVIYPDGTARPPEGAKTDGIVANCKADPGRPPCFCPNCRAARR